MVGYQKFYFPSFFNFWTISGQWREKFRTSITEHSIKRRTHIIAKSEIKDALYIKYWDFIASSISVKLSLPVYFERARGEVRIFLTDEPVSFVDSYWKNDQKPRSACVVKSILNFKNK